MVELQHIDRAECLRLLAAERFGRVAVSSVGQSPLIRPVNYFYDERSQSIVFRTAEGSKLHRLLATRKATFEIDGLDRASRTGWSVIVQGVAEPIVDPLEMRRLERAPLDPWAPGDKPHLVRIRARTVTGRRVVELEAFDEESVVFRNATPD
jgi:nitroimidazol reductase NimA-like FMN-containing flavoprotein (pyridoxamine 5'-phosphate oxidase superfamily)